MDALHTYLMWFEYANLEDFMLWNGYGFAAFERLQEHGVTTIDWLAKATPQEISEKTGLDEITSYEVLFEAMAAVDPNPLYESHVCFCDQ